MSLRKRRVKELAKIRAEWAGHVFLALKQHERDLWIEQAQITVDTDYEYVLACCDAHAVMQNIGLRP